MENNYYQKYLKYKSKYLELKNLIGSGACFDKHGRGNSCKKCCEDLSTTDKVNKCKNTCK